MFINLECLKCGFESLEFHISEGTSISGEDEVVLSGKSCSCYINPTAMRERENEAYRIYEENIFRPADKIQTINSPYNAEIERLEPH